MPNKEVLTTALKMTVEPMAEILTQPERRRRWTSEQKLALVSESLRPGASPTQVARRYGISTGLLYTVAAAGPERRVGILRFLSDR